MEPRELAREITKILSDKLAADIRVLEVTDLTTLADFFILATGTSEVHLKTLADEVAYKLKKQDLPLPRNIEGRGGSSWLLLDYGSVIVHILLAEARTFYSIERLWADAKQWSEGDL